MPATHFAQQINPWRAPAKQADPYLSEPHGPAMQRVMLELSPQSTLAAEAAERQVAAEAAAATAAAAAAASAPSPAEQAAREKAQEVAAFVRRVEQEALMEQQRANPGPPLVYRLASEVDAELAAQQARQVAELDGLAESAYIPAPPAPEPGPAPRVTMYSDPLV